MKQRSKIRVKYEVRSLTNAHAAEASAVIQESFLALAAAAWRPDARSVFLEATAPASLLKGPRPLDTRCALFNASQDLVDEICPSAISEVSNDRICDGRATVQRRKVRQVMHGTWSETF